jgi:glutamate-5-semialdehyde dehydrogenase
MDGLGRQARDAARVLAMSGGDARNAALRAASKELQSRRAEILEANAIDMHAARERGLSAAMLDRLMLDDSRIDGMASGLEAIAALPDPLGRIMAEWQRPNGLAIQRVAVPLGVIGIIYESRPNVMEDAGLPANCVQMVPTTDRAAVGYLLSSMSQWVDVVVPRGGKNLIRRVQEEARVPVIGHLEGICHVYLHEAADAAMAAEIAVNAKMRRTGICGAAETLLVDRAAAGRLLPGVLNALSEAGCEIRGDHEVTAIFPDAREATEDDWGTEYLDAIISVRVVDAIEAAIQHIAEYGSGHTECIVTNDDAAADTFFRNVDSAILLHNASTQFADGGEFGMGAEIGIATGRIHARGPVGAEQLTSYKYVVRGSGQTRP